jgi:hypothetical protein
MGELEDKKKLVMKIQNKLVKHSEDTKKVILKIQNRLDDNSENINNIDYIDMCNLLMKLHQRENKNMNRELCEQINTDMILRYEHRQEQEDHKNLVMYYKSTITKLQSTITKLRCEIDINKLMYHTIKK